MRRPFLAFRLPVALLILLVEGVFLHSAETNFWSDRARASRRLRSSDGGGFVQAALTSPTAGGLVTRAISPDLLPPVEPLTLAAPTSPRASSGFPAEWATALSARGVWREYHPAGSGAPLAILLQDVHGDRVAQKNMAELLRVVLDRAPDAGVALEGAAGDVRLDRLRSGDPVVDRRSAAFFFNAGLINGPEYAVWSAAPAANVRGVEDPVLYRRNLAAVPRAGAARAAFLPLWDAWRERLGTVTRRHFSPALRDLAESSRAYRAGRQGVGEHAAFLAGSARLAGLPLGGQLRLFLDTQALERSLDLAAVRRDRARFLSELSRRLEGPALDRVMAAALALRSSSLSPGAFHRLLREEAGRSGVRLGNYPALEVYARYTTQADGLRAEALDREARDLEEALWRHWTLTPLQAELGRLVRDADLVEGLTSLSLTPTEWTAYAARRGDIRRLNVRLMALEHAAPVSAVQGAPDLASLLPAYEDFYDAASARNAALARGMERNGRFPRVTVLVAGGFHTSEITRILTDRGVGVAVFSPRLSESEEEASGDPFALFLRDRTPLEALFASPRLTLAEPLAVHPVDPADPRAAAVASLSPAVNAALRDLGASPDGVVLRSVGDDRVAGSPVLVAQSSEPSSRGRRNLRRRLAGATALLEDVSTEMTGDAGPRVSVYRRGLSLGKRVVAAFRGIGARSARAGWRRWTTLTLAGLLLFGGLAAPAAAYDFAASPAGVEMTLARGETLWEAAQKIHQAGGLRDQSLPGIVKAIQDANPDTIQSPDLVHPGVVYHVPGVSGDAADALTGGVVPPPSTGSPMTAAPDLSIEAPATSVVAPSVTVDLGAPLVPQEASTTETAASWNIPAEAAAVAGALGVLVLGRDLAGAMAGFRRRRTSRVEATGTEDRPLEENPRPIAEEAVTGDPETVPTPAPGPSLFPIEWSAAKTPASVLAPWALDPPRAPDVATPWAVPAAIGNPTTRPAPRPTEPAPASARASVESFPAPRPLWFTPERVERLVRSWARLSLERGPSSLPALSAFPDFSIDALIQRAASVPRRGWVRYFLQVLSRSGAFRPDQLALLRGLGKQGVSFASILAILRGWPGLFMVLPLRLVSLALTRTDVEGASRMRVRELAVDGRMNDDWASDPGARVLWDAWRRRVGRGLEQIHIVEGAENGEDTTRFVFLTSDGHLVIHRDVLDQLALFDHLAANRPEAAAGLLARLQKSHPHVAALDFAGLIGLLLDHEIESLAAFREAARRGPVTAETRAAIHDDAERRYPVETVLVLASDFVRSTSGALEGFQPPRPRVGGVASGDLGPLGDLSPDVASRRRLPNDDPRRRTLTNVWREVWASAAARAGYEWDGEHLRVRRRFGGELSVRLDILDAPEWTASSDSFALAVLAGEGVELGLYLPAGLADLDPMVQRETLEASARQVLAVVRGETLSNAYATDNARDGANRRRMQSALLDAQDGVITRVLTRNYFEQHVGVTAAEILQINIGADAGPMVDEELMDGGVVGTSEYADPTATATAPVVKRQSTVAAVTVGVEDASQSPLRWAASLVEELRRLPGGPHRVLVNRGASGADVIARVLAANGVAVDWVSQTAALPSLAAHAAGLPGRYALVVSGATLMDGDGRVIPPALMAELRNRASRAEGPVRLARTRRHARERGWLTVIGEDLDAGYAGRLAAAGAGGTRLVVDLRKLEVSQGDEYEALFRQAKIDAVFLRERDPRALERAVMQERKTGRRALGLVIHQHGQKLRLVDGDGRALEPWVLEQVLAESGDIDALSVTPWTFRAVEEAAARRGLPRDAQPAPRASRRHPSNVFGGDVLLTALAAARRIDADHPTLASRASATPVTTERRWRLSPRHREALLRTLKTGSASDIGAGISRRAGRTLESSRLAPVNGSGNNLFLMDAGGGRLWISVDEDEAVLRAEGRDGAALVRAARRWVDGLAPTSRWWSSAAGAAVLTLLYAGFLGVAFAAVYQPGLLWMVTDHVPVLVEYYMSLLAANGWLGVIGYVIAANLFVLGEEALFSGLRVMMARRFAAGRSRVWDLHPFLRDDPRLRLADLPTSWGSRSLFVGWSQEHHDVFKGIRALPPFLQVLLYARDLRLSQYHVRRHFKERWWFSYFLLTLFSYAFFRPLAIARAVTDVVGYMVAALRQRGAPDRTRRAAYGDVDVARMPTLARGVVAGVDGPERAYELKGRRVVVVSRAQGEGTADATPLVLAQDPADRRWREVADLARDEGVHLTLQPDGESPSLESDEIDDAVPFERESTRTSATSAIGYLWGQGLAEVGTIREDLAAVSVADPMANHRRLDRLLSEDALSESASRTFPATPLLGAVSQGPGMFTLRGGFGKTTVRVRWVRRDALSGESAASPWSWGGWWRGLPSANGTPTLELVLDERLLDLSAAARTELFALYAEGLAVPFRPPPAERASESLRRALVDLAAGHRWTPLPAAWLSVETETGLLPARTALEGRRAAQAFVHYLRRAAPGDLTPIFVSVEDHRSELGRAVLSVLAAEAARSGRRLRLARSPMASTDAPVGGAEGHLRVHVGARGITAWDRDGESIASRPRDAEFLSRILSLGTTEAESLDLSPAELVRRPGVDAWDGEVRPFEQMRREGRVAADAEEATGPATVRLPTGIRWAAWAAHALGIAGLIVAGAAFLWAPGPILHLQGMIWAQAVTNMGLIYFLRFIPMALSMLVALSPLLAYSIFYSRLHGKRRILDLVGRKDSDPELTRLGPPPDLSATPEWAAFHDMDLDAAHIAPSVTNVVSTGADGRLQINHRAFRIAYAWFLKESLLVAVVFAVVRRAPFLRVTREDVARARLLLFGMMEIRIDAMDRALSHVRWGIASLFFRKGSRWFLFFQHIVFMPWVVAQSFVHASSLIVNPWAIQLGPNLDERIPPEVAGDGWRIHRGVVRTANGLPQAILHDGSAVQIAGWSASDQGKVRRHLNTGDAVLILTRNDPAQKRYEAVVYVAAPRSPGEERWRRLDLLPGSKAAIAAVERESIEGTNGGAPLFVSFPRRSWTDRWSFVGDWVGPRLRPVFLGFMLFGPYLTFAWLSVAGLPAMYWSGGAWAAFLSAPSWIGAGAVLGPVGVFMGFLVAWRLLYDGAQWSLGLHLPGGHRLWKHALALAMSLLPIQFARAAYAEFQGQATSWTGDRSLDRSARLLLEESNTVSGLGDGARAGLRETADWVSRYRMAAGLPVLSAEEIRGILSPLDDPTEDPSRLLADVLRVLGALDGTLSEAPAALGMSKRLGWLTDIAHRHLTPQDSRFLPSVDRLRGALVGLFAELDVDLRAAIAGALTAERDLENPLAATEAVQWAVMGGQSADAFEANLFGSLRRLAGQHPKAGLGGALEDVRGSLDALRAARAPAAVGEGIKGLGASLDRFFARLEKTTPLPQSLSGALGLGARPHFFAVASENLPAGPSDRALYDVADARRAEGELEKAVQRTLDHYRSVGKQQGLGVERIHFQNYDIAALSSAPSALADAFEKNNLGLLRPLATGPLETPFRAVEEALSVLRVASPRDAASALTELKRSVARFLGAAAQRKEDLMKGVEGHPRGGETSREVDFRPYQLSGPVDEALRHDPRWKDDGGAGDLKSAYVALERGVQGYLVAHGRALVEDFRRSASLAEELKVTPTDDGAHLAVNLLVAGINIPLSYYGAGGWINPAWLESLFLDPNGDVGPAVQRMAAVHGVGRHALQAMLNGRADRLAEYDRLWHDAFDGIGSGSSGSELLAAQARYLAGMDAFDRTLPGARTAGGGGAAAVFNRGLVNAQVLSGAFRSADVKQPGAYGVSLLFQGLLRDQNDPELIQKSLRAFNEACQERARRWADAWGSADAGSERDVTHDLTRDSLIALALDAQQQDDPAPLLRGLTQRHAQFLTVMTRVAGESAVDSSARTALRRFDGAKNLEDVIARLPAYVADLRRPLDAAAQRYDASFRTGGDRALEDLLLGLDQFAQTTANAAAKTNHSWLDAFARVGATQNLPAAIVAALSAAVSIPAEREAQSLDLAKTLGRSLEGLFDKVDAVASGLPKDLMKAAAGGRGHDFFEGAPGDVAAAYGRLREDLTPLLSALRWHALHNAAQEGLTPGERTGVEARFDAFVRALDEAHRALAARVGEGDDRAAVLDYAHALNALWNEALADAMGTATSERAPRLDLPAVLLAAWNRDPAQSAAAGPTDDAFALQRLHAAVVRSTEEAIRFRSPDAAPALRSLRVLPTLAEDAATLAAFSEDARTLARDLNAAFRSAAPGARFQDLTAFWSGEPLAEAERLPQFWKFVEAVDANLRRCDPSYETGRLREALEASLRGPAAATDLTHRGFFPLVAFVNGRLATTPDDNLFRQFAFPEMARRLLYGGLFVEGPAEVPSAAARGMSAALSVMGRLAGRTFPGAAELERVFGSSSTDGEAEAGLRRLLARVDASLTGVPGYVPGQMVRVFQSAETSPVTARSLMGAYGAVLREVLTLVDQQLEQARERANDAVSAFADQPTRANALAALRAFDVEALFVAGAGTPSVLPAMNDAMTSVLGPGTWPEDPERLVAALQKAVAVGAEETARSVRRVDGHRLFPAASVQRAFADAVQSGRTEGQPLTSSHLRAGLLAATTELRRGVAELREWQTLKGSHAVDTGRSFRPVADTLFGGAAGDALRSALEDDIAARHEFLTRKADLVDPGFARDVDLPSVDVLAGASLARVQAWLVDYARAWDDPLSSRPLHYAPGTLVLKVEAAVAGASSPDEALKKGLKALYGGVTASLLDAHAWESRRLAFRDLAAEITAQLPRMTDATSLRAVCLDLLERQWAKAALFQANPPADPAAWAAEQVRGMAARMPLDESPESWVPRLAAAYDEFLQANGLGVSIRRGALVEAMERARASLIPGRGGIAGAKHLAAALFLAGHEQLEDAYRVRVEALTAGAAVADGLDEGWSLRQGPGLVVDHVERAGERVLVYMKDAPGRQGTRVALTGLPAASDELVERVAAELPTGTPVVVAVRGEATGREVAGALFAPRSGAGAVARPELVGRWTALTSLLSRDYGVAAAAGEIPAATELSSLGLTDDPERVAERLRLTGRGLADLGFILSGGDERVKARLRELSELYFSSERVVAEGDDASWPVGWWSRLRSWLGGSDVATPRTLREALAEGRFGEHVTHYVNDVLRELQSPARAAGGVALDIDQLRAQWDLTTRAGTLHESPTGRLPLWAALARQGLGTLSDRLLSPAAAAGDLREAFLEGLQSVTTWESFARNHRLMNDRLFDLVAQRIAAHGFPLPEDFEDQRLRAAETTELLLDPATRAGFMDAYRERVSSLLSRVATSPVAPLARVPNAAGLAESLMIYRILIGDVSDRLREMEGDWTVQALSAARPEGDALAQRLAAWEKLSASEKAALLAVGLLPGAATQKPGWRRAFSFSRVVYDRFVVYAGERALVRYTFGLWVTGVWGALVWSPSLIYKSSVWRALRADASEGDIADGLEGARVDARAFETPLHRPLLVLTERDSGAAGAPRRRLIHPAFTRLPPASQRWMADWADAEAALSAWPVVGGRLVHVIRLLEINQVVLGVGLMLVRAGVLGARPPSDRAREDVWTWWGTAPGRARRAVAAVLFAASLLFAGPSGAEVPASRRESVVVAPAPSVPNEVTASSVRGRGERGRLADPRGREPRSWLTPRPVAAPAAEPEPTDFERFSARARRWLDTLHLSNSAQALLIAGLGVFWALVNPGDEAVPPVGVGASPWRRRAAQAALLLGATLAVLSLASHASEAAVAGGVVAVGAVLDSVRQNRASGERRVRRVDGRRDPSQSSKPVSSPGEGEGLSKERMNVGDVPEGDRRWTWWETRLGEWRAGFSARHHLFRPRTPPRGSPVLEEGRGTPSYRDVTDEVLGADASWGLAGRDLPISDAPRTRETPSTRRGAAVVLRLLDPVTRRLSRGVGFRRGAARSPGRLVESRFEEAVAAQLTILLASSVKTDARPRVDHLFYLFALSGGNAADAGDLAAFLRDRGWATPSFLRRQTLMRRGAEDAAAALDTPREAFLRRGEEDADGALRVLDLTELTTAENDAGSRQRRRWLQERLVRRLADADSLSMDVWVIRLGRAEGAPRTAESARAALHASLSMIPGASATFRRLQRSGRIVFWNEPRVGLHDLFGRLRRSGLSAPRMRYETTDVGSVLWDGPAHGAAIELLQIIDGARSLDVNAWARRATRMARILAAAA